MSFFSTSEGEELEATTEFEISGIQPLIPDGMKLLSTVTGVTIEPESQYNNEHIVIELMVTQKGKYKDYTVNHKLQVNDDKPSKRDKAITMLLSYDSNAKGGLAKTDKAGKPIMEVGLLNRALNGTEVVAKYAVWEIEGDDGTTRSGNWVQGISDKSNEIALEDQNIIEQAQNQPTTPTAPAPAEDDLDSEILF